MISNESCGHGPSFRRLNTLSKLSQRLKLLQLLQVDHPLSNLVYSLVATPQAVAPTRGSRRRASTVDVQRSVLNLKVFFNYAVVEVEGSSSSSRILHFAFTTGTLQSVAKETVKWSKSFKEVIDSKLDDKNPLRCTVNFKSGT